MDINITNPSQETLEISFPDSPGSAASGTRDYNELRNKPSINGQTLEGDMILPTHTSELINDSNFVSDSNYTHTDNNYTTAEREKLSEIEPNAEVNIIEKVNVNGTEIIPANKEVDIIVPTKTSELLNDSNLVVDASYVHTDNNYTSTEKSKLSGIEANAQVNVVEKVRVNGTEISALNKAVDIPVPTKTSDLINDNGYVVDSSYVHTDNNFSDSIKQTYDDTVSTVAGLVVSGGEPNVVETIKVNGTALVPDANKAVDVEVPTNTSDLTNDSGFIDNTVNNLTNYTKSSDMANVATSGSYNDLGDKPTIPPEMVILSYGNSTWNDFINAYRKNAIVYCRASSSSNPASGSQTRLAFMAYVNNATNPTEVEFQYYRSVSSHSSSQQTDQVFVYKLNSSGVWTVITRECGTKVVAGTSMNSTYNNGAITLNTKAEISQLPGNVLPDEYNSTLTYELGSYCIYNNVLYKCTTAVTTAESFDSSKWTQTTITAELGTRLEFELDDEW